jgi:hypothetical protein
MYIVEWKKKQRGGRAKAIGRRKRINKKRNKQRSTQRKERRG